MKNQPFDRYLLLLLTDRAFNSQDWLIIAKKIKATINYTSSDIYGAIALYRVNLPNSPYLYNFDECLTKN